MSSCWLHRIGTSKEVRVVMDYRLCVVWSCIEEKGLERNHQMRRQTELRPMRIGPS